MAGHAGQGHQTAHALGDGVVAGAARVRPGLAEAGHGSIDDGGGGGAHGSVADSQPVRHAGQEVLDDDVGAPGQLEHDARALGLLKVGGQRPLVAVDGREDGAHAGTAAPVAQIVAAPRPLDLDDVGAEVAQEHRAVGPGDDAREVEDAKASQDHSRSRNPSVIALASGIPVRAIALMRAFTSASARNGLAARRSANARTSFSSRSPGTTRWTSPSWRASSAL